MGRLGLLGLALTGIACGATTTTYDDGYSALASDGGAEAVSASSNDGGATCAALPKQQARVACAANAVLASLSATQRAGVQFALTDYVTRSKWNNLPVGLRPRAGLQLASLSATSQAAVLDLMNLSLNDNGQRTLTGILRSDDYLLERQGGYGSSTYAIAIFGTPSASGDFEVMFGGHHMAYNLNFVGGRFYPVPQHLGAEPKGAFTIDGGTYAPMTPKGDAMFAVYTALDASARTEAYLSGQVFNDVVVAPGLDYGKGSARTSKSAYPTGSNRRGVIVSKLTPAQQALVTEAIAQFARQYPSEVADALMADYAAGYDDTYFGWGGKSSGPDQDVSGSYLRIDGPRVWIELSVQNGIVIRGQTHFHSVYHDKIYDYGGEF